MISLLSETKPGILQVLLAHLEDERSLAQTAKVLYLRPRCWTKGLPRLTQGHSYPVATPHQPSLPLGESTFLSSKEGCSFSHVHTSKTAKQGGKVAGATRVCTKLIASFVRAHALRSTQQLTGVSRALPLWYQGLSGGDCEHTVLVPGCCISQCENPQ